MLQSSLGLTSKELAIFRRLDSPKKIQSYLDGLRQNFNRRRDTCQSPRQVLRLQRAHCIEAAILAAAV